MAFNNSATDTDYRATGSTASLGLPSVGSGAHVMMMVSATVDGATNFANGVPMKVTVPNTFGSRTRVFSVGGAAGNNVFTFVNGSSGAKTVTIETEGGITANIAAIVRQLS